MIPHSPLEARLKSTFEHSREVVRRAHQRAESAIERAQRMREGLRRVRAAVPEGADGRKLSLLELAVEESARSLREKEHFIAVLAHELRQPLNAALAAARVASVSASPEVIHRARAVIERQLLQLAILLEDLSEVSRLTLRQGDLRREPVSIRDVLSAAAESVQVRAADKGVTLNVTRPLHASGRDGDGHIRDRSRNRRDHRQRYRQRY